MSWEALIEILNSPTGKKLDRVAKKMVRAKALSLAVGFIGFGEINEIVAEILNHVTDSNNVS